MSRILLLEDEVDFREEIADFLISEGHSILEASTLAEFEPLIGQFDIAVVDIGLPDGSGRDAATQLRARQSQCGIIMLTALSDMNNRIGSLHESADCYLVKPVNFDELLAHVIALERRLVVRWQLDTVERELRAPYGHWEALTEHEMTLLQLLAGNPGKVVTRQAIAGAFGIRWLDFDDRRLDQTVSRLRRRWRSQSGQDLPCRTEHGKGFSFCADIEVL